VLGSLGVRISMFGSAIGFVNMAAGERCMVANVAALVTERVEGRLILEC
jgi:hypothetical protein